MFFVNILISCLNLRLTWILCELKGKDRGEFWDGGYAESFQETELQGLMGQGKRRLRPVSNIDVSSC